MLLAIFAGNIVYFAVNPILPPYLKHTTFVFDPGLVLDLAICIAAYLVIRLL